MPLPADERPQQYAAGRDDEEGQREPERLDRGVLRLQPAPRARLEGAEDDRSDADGREDRTQEIETGPGAVADSVVDKGDHRQDADDDHDLAHELHAPAQLVVVQPPRIGPIAMPAPATPPMIA